jgi:hypothetical protein
MSESLPDHCPGLTWDREQRSRGLTMQTYTVEWTCELRAESAEEASRLALDVFAKELANGSVRALDTYSDAGNWEVVKLCDRPRASSQSKVN